jgi:hypothetical protein
MIDEDNGTAKPLKSRRSSTRCDAIASALSHDDKEETYT